MFNVLQHRHPRGPLTALDRARLSNGWTQKDPSDCGAFENPRSVAADVVVLWGHDVLHVAHLKEGSEFTVGESDQGQRPCHLFMPEELLGSTRLSLLAVSHTLVTLTVPRNAVGYLRTARGDTVALEQLRGLPGAQTDTLITLAPGDRACLQLATFTFQFAAVPAAINLARGHIAAMDRETFNYFGASVTAATAMLMAMAYFVPAQNGLDETAFDQDQIYAMRQFLTASAEREREAQATEPAAAALSKDEGGTGTRAQNEEGAMGNPRSRAVNKSYAVKGPQDNPDPHLAKEHLLAHLQEYTIIGLLGGGSLATANVPTAPWGRDEALGNDAISAMGNMWGDEPGEAFGIGGLAVSGVGQGSGGRGVGIGLGDIGTWGHGRGLGSGQGFGNDAGKLANGSHRTRAFRLRPGLTTVSGRLPPEIIQRVVRQNYGRFRNCYEQGLARNPNLEGRVQVRFVIGRDGAVNNVQNGGSDLPDSAVVGCVVSAYYGLSFPEPEGGIVTVVYPIMFQPS